MASVQRVRTTLDANHLGRTLDRSGDCVGRLLRHRMCLECAICALKQLGAYRVDVLSKGKTSTQGAWQARFQVAKESAHNPRQVDIPINEEWVCVRALVRQDPRALADGGGHLLQKVPRRILDVLRCVARPLPEEAAVEAVDADLLDCLGELAVQIL